MLIEQPSPTMQALPAIEFHTQSTYNNRKKDIIGIYKVKTNEGSGIYIS